MSIYIKTLCLALVIALWFPTKHAIAEPYIAPYTPSVRQIIVKQATVYAIPAKKILWVANCESQYNTKAWNKSDPGVGSKGLFQFQEATFYGYAKELQIANPDIWNAEQQSQVAAYLFSKNKSSLWTCARQYDKIYIK